MGVPAQPQETEAEASVFCQQQEQGEVLSVRHHDTSGTKGVSDGGRGRTRVRVKSPSLWAWHCPRLFICKFTFTPPRGPGSARGSPSCKLTPWSQCPEVGKGLPVLSSFLSLSRSLSPDDPQDPQPPPPHSCCSGCPVCWERALPPTPAALPASYPEPFSWGGPSGEVHPCIPAIYSESIIGL